MSSFKKYYRKLIPSKLRGIINEKRKKGIQNHLKKSIISYFDLNEGEGSKYYREIEYIKNKGFEVFPYSFVKNYEKEKIEVLKEKSNDLYYVIHNDKRLYFPKTFSSCEVQQIYNNLIMEQDKESPHRYFSSDFKFEKGEVFVDVGSAEGIIALEVVDLAKKIYLFEADSNWKEALEETFKPWKEKVTIIDKFVSDKNTIETVTLDSVFSNHTEDLFLKIDVEGAESLVLKGAKKIFSNVKKIAICTYHNKNDAEDFKTILSNKNLNLEFSNGYMVWTPHKDVEAPFFRRGVLRGCKSSMGAGNVI